MSLSSSTGGEETNQDLAHPVLARCRPGPAGWFVAFLLVIFGGLGVAAAPGSSGDAAGLWVEGCLAAGLLVPGLALTAWLLRAQVVAGDAGLQWRGLGRWRYVAWAQVTDYYEKPFPRGQQLIVETSDGAIKLSQENWSDLPRFRYAVEQHATQAVAQTWGSLGTRPEEQWPLAFGYHRTDERVMGVVLWFCALGGLGLTIEFFAAPHLRGIVDITRGLGWPLGLLGGAVWLGFGLILPAMMLPMGLSFSEIRRRRSHRIIADADGLDFEEDGRRVAAKWSEVTDYFVAPLRGSLGLGDRCIIITTRGTFDFTPFLRDAIILKRAIAHQAKNALAVGWRTRADEALGGEASRRGRDAQGRHERIYHYRTRTNRALLWLPTAITLAIALLPMLVAQASIPLDPGSDRFVELCEMAIGAATAWGWWRYHSASVLTNSRGVTQYTWRGRRYLPWDQVHAYYQTDEHGFIVGARDRIRFWLTLGDVEELKAEVARRSAYCHGKEWEVRRK